MRWTTPEDVRAQVERLWERGRILASRLVGEPLFPLTLRLVRPTARELGESFTEARAWIRSLEAGSRRATGHGYEVVYGDINHRQLGPNRLPRSVLVPSEQDALALIGKRRQSETFDRLVNVTKDPCPELLIWIAKHPLELLERAAEWERILAVVRWLRSHPRPGIYTRQIGVTGTHTKFLEMHKRLLAELLDLALPTEAIDRQAVGMQGFEQRYGLAAKPALVRFRALDKRAAICGLDDVSTPVAQFARLDLPVRRVFITENEINGLAFPPVDDSIIIFGLGYGIEQLACVPWLADKTVLYWGDLDTHGFAILDRLRALLPARVRFSWIARRCWTTVHSGLRRLQAATGICYGSPATKASSTTISDSTAWDCACAWNRNALPSPMSSERWSAFSRSRPDVLGPADAQGRLNMPVRTISNGVGGRCQNS
jgi:hypothetical protein